MDPVLPQTNPAGGPNPNSGFSMSLADLPKFGGSADGAQQPWNRGAAIAAMAAGMRSDPNAPPPPPTADQRAIAAGQATGLPAYDPNAASLVQTPANGVAGTTGLQGMLGARGAQDSFDARVMGLQRQAGPSTLDAIHNWLFNAPGSPEAAAYDQRRVAGETINRPEVHGYLSAHPSLLAHAEADPVGFATKLGPIIDAAVAAQHGPGQPGVVAHPTIDGPMLKVDQNPAMTKAIAQGYGISEQHAHALTQPHHYTDQEWLAATEGLSRGALKNMWEMHHYLNPQQQAQALYLTELTKQYGQQQQDPNAAGRYLQSLREMNIPGVALPQAQQ